MPDEDTHMMLDLETWGAGSRAVIVEAGACVFEPEGDVMPVEPIVDRCFYRAVDPQSALNLGMEVDASTILWWIGADESRRARVLDAHQNKKYAKVHEFLDSLGSWMVQHKVKYIWAHGATFDPVILQEYYRRLRKDQPFNFRNVRDTRTFYSMFDLTEEEWKEAMQRKEKHHPVYDAWAQARAIQYCLKKERDGEASAINNTAGQ